MAGSRRRRLSRVPPTLVALIVPLALLSPACASSGSSAGGAPTDDAKITELRSIAELQDRFNEDAGKVRLILLISPT
jgi:hypothetical protein